VEVVAGPGVAHPGPAVAGAPVGEAELGVVGARDPDGRPAGLPGVAGPGLAAGLAGLGDRVGLPDLLARLGVVRGDEAADAVLAAGDAHEDLARGGEGRQR